MEGIILDATELAGPDAFTVDDGVDVEASNGAFTCTPAEPVVEPAAGVTDNFDTTVTCALDGAPGTVCTYQLTVQPHPLLVCPTPSVDTQPLRAEEAAQLTTPFDTDLDCDVASLSAIPPVEFPQASEDPDTRFTVTCRTAGNPNTCSFDITLRGPARVYPSSCFIDEQ